MLHLRIALPWPGLKIKVQESYKVQVNPGGCFKTCCVKKNVTNLCTASYCSLQHHLHFLASQPWRLEVELQL